MSVDRIELVAIGNELLLGHTLDTNGADIARALSALGVEIVRRSAVPDRPEEIAAAVADALRRTGAVITTGGLGPTRDDMSKKAVADLYGMPLEFDETVWADIVARFARAQRARRSRATADRPKCLGAPPCFGTGGAPRQACGWRGRPDSRSCSRACRARCASCWSTRWRPGWQPSAGGAVVRSLVVRTTAIPESTLAERLGDVEREIAPLTLAYLPGIHGVDLRLTAWRMEPAEARPSAARGGRPGDRHGPVSMSTAKVTWTSPRSSSSAPAGRASRSARPNRAPEGSSAVA